jgi:Protein of unknown function (DUF3570)
VAATELLRRARLVWRAICSRCGQAFFGGMLVTTSSPAANLPEDKAELLVHSYDGGGVRATGPAFLVRKSVADKVSLSGQYYVDAVSNASIDVVTTASPFRETRKAYELGAQTVVRDATLSLSVSSSSEPDYLAKAVNFDVAHEVFGGMSTISLGYTQGADKVGKKGVVGWIDEARHWQYRAGLTQILSPTWLLSLNAEALLDSGELGSPYRVARQFGAAVAERNPRTRSARAVKLRSLVDTGQWLPGSAVRAEYRAYWDNWQIRAGTAEFGFSKHLGERFLLDTSLRLYRQSKALFYSDDAQTDPLYLSRNRQLSNFNSTGLGATLSYTWPGLPAGYSLKLNAALEHKSFRFKDFNDLRTGQPYSHDANIVQAYVSATF